MKTHKPADQLQDLQFFGEYGGVNPSISDSSTFTFLTAKSMMDTFDGETEGCFLYSRHTSPSNIYLAEALARMEGTEAAHTFGSGMGAITATLMQLCIAGDHIVTSRTIYGGTYAFLKNFAPKFGITSSFVDITSLEAIEKAITKDTKVLYCEALSNPLLEVASIPELSALAKKHQLTLVVDNTFTPLCISPAKLGADVVIHSLTKFINGSSDCVAGAVCGSQEFIDQMRSVADGAAMLFGSTLDSMRASSILKNLRTLPVRMQKHSANALYLAENLSEMGLKVDYPGLTQHRGHEKMKLQLNEDFGFSGLLTLDVGTLEKANEVMEMMQHKNVGYLAVSLGFYKTLFSASGTSTSSEIPEDEQASMGLSAGLIRFSIGLDFDIERTFNTMIECLEVCGVLTKENA
jgi:methionine-gamma-lyase